MILPAQLEWGVRIPVPAGRNVTVSGSTGTVCLDSAIAQHEQLQRTEGAGKRAGQGLLSPDAKAGALISKISGSLAYFSINGRSGADFQKHRGYFEFDVEFR